MAAIPDFIYPQTKGERPADFAEAIAFENAVVRLAVRDPEVHKLWEEVHQLSKPLSAYREPALLARVQEEMDEVAQETECYPWRC